MQQTIKFETVIESGFIRVPEQYAKSITSAVKVTLSPVSESNIIMGIKSKAGNLSLDDFTEIKLDTRGWKFNREEANERR